MLTYHNPVLLKQSVDFLITDKNGIYVDVTYGGGGHSRKILECISDDAKLFAFDQDEDALVQNINDNRLTLINANFKFLKSYLKFYQISKIDGVLADLGVSSHQFNEPNRGFSIRFDDAPLDSRMSINSTVLTAERIVNDYSLEQLKLIFTTYGELKNAYKIASAIINFREKTSIKTVAQLKDAISIHIPKFQENKFLAQVMQALRIEINQELEVLQELILQSCELLKPSGRLVVISYHSLEDRLVKNFFKSGNFEGLLNKDFYGNILRPFSPLHSKAIVPDEEEIEINSRARSAKLRIAVKN